jgi:hypothetical protein
MASVVSSSLFLVDKYVVRFFLILVCEAIGTAATSGLLCQPRVIVKMIVEKQMECRLAGKPKFSEKTCPSATFVHHKIPHDQTRVRSSVNSDTIHFSRLRVLTFCFRNNIFIFLILNGKSKFKICMKSFFYVH